MTISQCDDKLIFASQHACKQGTRLSKTVHCRPSSLFAFYYFFTKVASSRCLGRLCGDVIMPRFKGLRVSRGMTEWKWAMQSGEICRASLVWTNKRYHTLWWNEQACRTRDMWMTRGFSREAQHIFIGLHPPPSTLHPPGNRSFSVLYLTTVFLLLLFFFLLSFVALRPFHAHLPSSLPVLPSQSFHPPTLANKSNLPQLTPAKTTKTKGKQSRREKKSLETRQLEACLLFLKRRMVVCGWKGLLFDGCGQENTKKQRAERTLIEKVVAWNSLFFFVEWQTSFAF